MSKFHPATIEEAREFFRPMKRTAMARKGISVRRVSKRETPDGASERELRDDCDQIVRDIIKLRDFKCATCWAHEDLHVGHLFKRGKHRVRWNLLNVAGQCDPCNELHNAEPEHYVEAFLMKHGEAAYNQLRTESRSGAILTYVELLATRDGLRSELRRMKG